MRLELLIQPVAIAEHLTHSTVEAGFERLPVELLWLVQLAEETACFGAARHVPRVEGLCSKHSLSQLVLLVDQFELRHLPADFLGEAGGRIGCGGIGEARCARTREKRRPLQPVEFFERRLNLRETNGELCPPRSVSQCRWSMQRIDAREFRLHLSLAKRDAGA